MAHRSRFGKGGSIPLAGSKRPPGTQEACFSGVLVWFRGSTVRLGADFGWSGGRSGCLLASESRRLKKVSLGVGDDSEPF